MKKTTPLTYYGGKQKMLKHILPLIPEHATYIEPFFGGGSVFWNKEPSNFEVVNDINHRLIEFYKVLKYDYEEISNLVDETFHSRALHSHSKVVYDSQEDRITRPIACAWAIWTQASQSFSSQLGSTFGYDRKGSVALRLYNKKNAFTEAYKERLRKVTIESYDALKVMRTYDAENVFFYIDPPYVSSDQGHYSGYNDDDFTDLLDFCANMKGKFLLSSYPETSLKEYIAKHNWNHEQFTKTVAVDGRRKGKKEKIECLTYNYQTP